MDKFGDIEKNIHIEGWLSGRFLCPICLYTGGYVFPLGDEWLECPKCADVSHIDECIIEWFPHDDSDDDYEGENG